MVYCQVLVIVFIKIGFACIWWYIHQVSSTTLSQISAVFWIPIRRIRIQAFCWIRIRIRAVANLDQIRTRILSKGFYWQRKIFQIFACLDPDPDPLTHLNPEPIRIRNNGFRLQNFLCCGPLFEENNENWSGVVFICDALKTYGTLWMRMTISFAWRIIRSKIN